MWKKKFKMFVPVGGSLEEPSVTQTIGQNNASSSQVCEEFEKQMSYNKNGTIIPVEITVLPDKSFKIKYFKPTNSFFVKRVSNTEYGSSLPKKELAGRISLRTIYEICMLKYGEKKSAHEIRGMCKMLIGTSKSIGILLKKRDKKN